MRVFQNNFVSHIAPPMTLTVFSAAVLQLCAVHRGGVQHLDEPQGAVHAAHQQQVLGLTAPQGDGLRLGPGKR